MIVRLARAVALVGSATWAACGGPQSSLGTVASSAPDAGLVVDAGVAAARERDVGPSDAGATSSADGSSASAEDAGSPPIAEAADADVPAPDERGAELVRRGRRTYRRVCASCHEGGQGGARPLARRRYSRAHVARQVRRGGRRMPPISASRLSQAELEALLVFFRHSGVVRSE